MANLARRTYSDPFAALAADFFHGFPAAAQDHWSPRVDVHETEDSVLIEADLPGIKPENVEIDVEGDVLTLSGERKTEREEKGEGYHRSERTFGRFERRFALPETVDREKIGAGYKDGVLTITLPKREAVKPRKIEVSAG